MVLACWKIVLELAPWLLLGAFLSGVIHVSLPRNFLSRYLSGRWGVLRAVLIGIPLPLCSCGVIPTAIGLRRDGATRGSTVGFLISTPQTGVDSILVSAAMLGWPFALFKVFAALILGLIGGFLTDFIQPEERDETPHLLPGSSVRPPWTELWSHSLEVVQSIWRWLLIGVVISALLEITVPPQWLEHHLGNGVVGGMIGNFVVLAVAVPLYVCATSSVPIAATLVSRGFPVGSALVFLVAGPATNVATILAVTKHLGRRAMLVYLATISIGSIVLSLFFSWVVSTTPAYAPQPHYHGPSFWRVVAAVLFLIVMAWCAFLDLRRWFERRFDSRRNSASVILSPSMDLQATLGAANSQPSGDRIQTIGVQGMTCQNCASRLQKALSKTDGVTSAQVDLDSESAQISGDASLQQLEKVVTDCGFQVR